VHRLTLDALTHAAKQQNSGCMYRRIAKHTHRTRNIIQSSTFIPNLMHTYSLQ